MASENTQITIDDVLEQEAVVEDVNFPSSPTVVQDNYLIQNKPRMTKNELKMFLTLVAAIGKDDDELKTVRLRVKDVISLWNISSKNAYAAVKKSLAGLLDKKFSLEYYRDDGTRYIEMATYISSFSYGEGDGYATVSIDPLFKPYLLNLNRTFTQFALKEALNLDAELSIRTFELLVQYESIGKRTFTVAEYKKLLGISDMYKGNNGNLKRNVLDKVVVEITEKTHMLTRYDLKGRGDRAIITFDIYRKEDTVYAKTNPKEHKWNDNRAGSKERDMLVQLLKQEYGMDKDFSEEQIITAVNIATNEIAEKKEILSAYNILVDALLDYRDRKIITQIEHPWAYFKAILESKVV